ncbi:glycine zipper family protein [Geomonas sp. Red32]|uniref:glycine zipper family protein n=1 Tax=Geomonas sp. Red32 TaxID=2912856 RepID=UPI00202CB822|nr:glycine zipper family protein [Geomonas sp. Red32]MCM0083906.1 glycine zipper family protein [Geomonas sp. Red32]
MRYMRRMFPFMFLAVAAGCATMPAGPSVNVLPAPGKSFEQFQVEDNACRQWADRQVGQPAQETYEKNTATGAVAGTALGAGVGAALGSASHHAGTGAVIGAATGLLFGSAIGSDQGTASARQVQRRYDNAYMQCMYSYGNQIPGVRRTKPRKVAQAPVAPPPPVAAPAPPPVISAPPAVEIPDPPPAVAPAPVSPPQVVTDPPPPVVVDDEVYYQPAPEIYFNEAPQFVYYPSMNMYVAVGTPYDLVYTGNEYYYFYGGRWYRSPYYNGPWVYAPRRSYPAFYRYRIDNIRHYREVEYRRYMRNRAEYRGRWHRPEYRRAKGRPEFRDERRR